LNILDNLSKSILAHFLRAGQVQSGHQQQGRGRMEKIIRKINIFKIHKLKIIWKKNLI
jgi:hypothetical protein